MNEFFTWTFGKCLRLPCWWFWQYDLSTACRNESLQARLRDLIGRFRSSCSFTWWILSYDDERIRFDAEESASTLVGCPGKIQSRLVERENSATRLETYCVHYSCEYRERIAVSIERLDYLIVELDDAFPRYFVEREFRARKDWHYKIFILDCNASHGGHFTYFPLTTSSCFSKDRSKQWKIVFSYTRLTFFDRWCVISHRCLTMNVRIIHGRFPIRRWNEISQIQFIFLIVRGYRRWQQLDFSHMFRIGILFIAWYGDFYVARLNFFPHSIVQDIRSV